MSLLPILSEPTPCAGRWDLFDSTDFRDHQTAKALCATCPIFKDCWDNLQAVLRADASMGGSPVGTWAGMLFGQHGSPARRAGCGTHSGYHAHRRNQEKPCSDCLEARRVYRNRNRGVVAEVRRNASPDAIDEAAVDRVLNGETIPTTTAERRVIMRRWIDAGNSERSLCDRMGWKAGRYAPKGDAA